MGLGLSRLNLGLHGRGGGASASAQLLTLATAAGAEAVYNPDDEDTWTLRDDGSSLFYSAAADGLATLPNITQGTAANQPDQLTLSTGARSFARTGGSVRRLTTTFTTISQPSTLFLVGRLGNTTTPSQQRFFDNISFGTGRQIITLSGGNFQIWAGTFLSGPAADTDWHIFQANFNGSSSEFFIDGVSVATGSAGTNGLGGVQIMSDDSATLSMADGGRVGPIIIFPDLKTNAETADIRANINARWPIGLSE